MSLKLAGLSVIALLLFGAPIAQEAAVDSDTIPNELIVRFHEDRVDRAGETLVFEQSGAIGRKEFPFVSHTMLLVFPDAVDLARIEAIRRNPNVRFVSVNHRVTLSVLPNDPQFFQQWNLRNTGQSGGTTDVDIDANEAWDNSVGSSTVTVAVVDTGVRTTHEDLAANLLPGWNFVTNNSDVNDDSSNGHGTTVSGIIGAVGNNGKGVAGVNWTVKIMPLVWLDFIPPGGGEETIVAAMAYARNNNVKIVNCSLNGNVALGAVKDEIMVGETHGVLYIFSAGNAVNQTKQGVDVEVGSIGAWPCKNLHPNLICVTAVDRFGNRPSWANYGVRRVHLGGPGVDIYSTLNGNDAHYGKSQSSLFPAGSGTSFAAPHMTGVVALVKAKNPAFTYKELKEFILLGAQPTPTGSLDGKTHMAGMVNADTSILGFGDSFDDAATDSRFFSNATTGARWAVGLNTLGPKCDTLVKQISGTIDQTAEISYSGIAGTSGSTWTLAGYEASYPPGANVQSLVLRVTTSDGSDFTGKTGRIGVGVIGDTGQSQSLCPVGGLSYTRMTFGGSMIAGIELNTGRPFIYFDPPYSETIYSPINLTGVKKLSIALAQGSGAASVAITNSITGAVLFVQEGIPYPNPWNWTGTNKGTFIYYGTASGSGTLRVRSFLSARP